MDAIPRLLEDAADELARLDTTCAAAPAAASAALRIALVARLAGELGGAGALGTLVALHADPAAESRTPEPLLRWWRLLGDEERRARGGVPITAARVERLRGIGPDAPLGPDLPMLETVLRDSAPRRAALDRAVDAAALIDDPALADAAAALVLCAAGRTDRLRLAPFGRIPPEERARAIAEWRAGDAEPWRRLALGALATSARELRLALERLQGGRDDEEARLVPLGRAAITARDVLEALRERLSGTMPALAEQLGISRPAAADALERLGAAGLVVEVTGRRRDRAYAYEAAFSIGAAAAS